MGKDSKIQWTDHTFNPWWGCTKVSPACTNCYAEAFARRTGRDLWGPRADRMVTKGPWKEALRWDRDARASGERARVFCSSMADVFEEGAELDSVRARLWTVIEATPSLDWLLLTKRPHLVHRLVPWRTTWPTNVWLGTTAENQEWADRRIPELLANPAVLHFVSAEPLLGPLDLTRWLGDGRVRSGPSTTIDWVIVGGESGGRARAMDPAWARALRDQVVAQGVPFHFKQWGEFGECAEASPKRAHLTSSGEVVYRLGTKNTGRQLDGRDWDQLPRVAKRLLPSVT
ncbi:MAG: phage Gp37/Gp68 family protein [Myxococcales bacterium]|nr:phage Gp37/Gp68 family protein [Myxococcales bacterium]